MPDGVITLLVLALAAPADDLDARSHATLAAATSDARMSLDEARKAVLRAEGTDHVPLDLLIELAGENNPRVRRAAAGALRGRGPAAKAALPALVQSLADNDDGPVIDLL